MGSSLPRSPPKRWDRKNGKQHRRAKGKNTSRKALKRWTRRATRGGRVTLQKRHRPKHRKNGHDLKLGKKKSARVGNLGTVLWKWIGGRKTHKFLAGYHKGLLRRQGQTYTTRRKIQITRGTKKKNRTKGSTRPAKNVAPRGDQQSGNTRGSDTAKAWGPTGRCRKETWGGVSKQKHWPGLPTFQNTSEKKKAAPLGHYKQGRKKRKRRTEFAEGTSRAQLFS